ncbi:hypothetical protein G3T15_15815 [Bacillus velezensis]|uniref:hypothetical protein n=1 Tax=Bacillus velezensis TaxID=492670 RepID=UPI0013BC3ED7|nr:hypothetical protein [Bacillus velezensis]NER69845.1 hypothetical protein [Bacillus velezensis]
MNIESLKKAFDERRRDKTYQKRLLSLAIFLNDEYEMNIRINGDLDSTRLLTKIIEFCRDHRDQEEEVLSICYDIFYEKYTRGTPYFFSNFSGVDSESNLYDMFTEMFEETNTFEYQEFDFNKEDIRIDEQDHSVTIELKYKQYFIDRDGERVTPLDQGSCSVIFLTRKKLCIGTGNIYRRIFDKFTEFITNNFSLIRFKHIYILQKTKGRKHDVFDNVTLLTFYLLYKSLPRLEFTLNGVDRVKLSNSNAEYIKGIKMYGNRIFNDRDAIKRIYNMDKIISFRFDFMKVINEINGAKVQVEIDFKSIFNITFSDTEYTNIHNRDFAITLFEEIIRLTENRDELKVEGAKCIEKVLTPLEDYQEDESVVQLSEIKSDLIKSFDTESYDPEIKNIIITYFRDKWSIE